MAKRCLVLEYRRMLLPAEESFSICYFVVVELLNQQKVFYKLFFYIKAEMDVSLISVLPITNND